MTVTYRPGLAPFVEASKLVGREGKPYHAHPDLVTAANVALAVDRPLLLTGEAGCGKTDFAFAVEQALRATGYCGSEGILQCHVRSDSRAQDLLYHYDAVERFGDAHFQSGETARRTDSRQYIKLLPLGEALQDDGPRVVLIDEIDKASRDLPNDLLHVLDQGWFEIREIREDAAEHPTKLRRRMGRTPERKRAEGKQPLPLVVITSNIERQLPDPFLRRCIFYHIGFPSDATLRAILAEWVGTGPLPLDQVITIFSALRGVKQLTKKPTTSELIDWATALSRVFEERAIGGALTTFAGLVDPKTPAPSLPWATLPALGCLVKLREDLRLLRAE